MSTSTGCRLMAPLNATCQATSPPEDLQLSEDDFLMEFSMVPGIMEC